MLGPEPKRPSAGNSPAGMVMDGVLTEANLPDERWDAPVSQVGAGPGDQVTEAGRSAPPAITAATNNGAVAIVGGRRTRP
ncbi:hypothetical protein Kisp02_45850 [Kineosporia sp. NBRC 101731]|nr:hypothetical protein Kisp02_45850 [Kineosporia sp. NBRC 101731]